MLISTISYLSGIFHGGRFSGRDSRRFSLCQSKLPSDSFKLQQLPKIRHDMRLSPLPYLWILKPLYPPAPNISHKAWRVYSWSDDQPVDGRLIYRTSYQTDNRNDSKSSNQPFTPNLGEINSIKPDTQSQLYLLLLNTVFRKNKRHTTASTKRLSILFDPYP